MLTWRTGVVALVLALAFAVVMPSVRAYLDQQAMLGELRADAEVARAEVDDLNAEVARWDDPNFLVAQARERLAYVFPGETPYRVVDPETVEGPAAGSIAAETDPAVLQGRSWYERLWESVEDAGGPVPELAGGVSQDDAGDAEGAQAPAADGAEQAPADDAGAGAPGAETGAQE